MEHELVLFEDASGGCQVRDFLRNQSKNARGHAGWMLQVLEERGQLLGRPAVGHLGDSIYELRVVVERHHYRILFFFDSQFIVATNAFLKKTDRVPNTEIDKAKRARVEWGAQRGKRHEHEDEKGRSP